MEVLCSSHVYMKMTPSRCSFSVFDFSTEAVALPWKSTVTPWDDSEKKVQIGSATRCEETDIKGVKEIYPIESS